MSQQRHLIGRTVLELDIGNLADVWSLQEEVSRLFQQQAVPEIERLFDRLVGINQVVRFDQVVVEVGSIDRRFLADEFLSKLLTALNQILSDILQDTILDEHLVALQSLNPITVIKRGSSGVARCANRTGADWEVLLYFLQYGRLPWWVSGGNWQTWFPRWEAVMQSSTNWRSPLQQLLATNTAVQRRLIEQFPESFRHQLIVQLQPMWLGWYALLTQARQVMQAMNLSNTAIQHLETQAWLLLLSEMGSGSETVRPLPTATWIRNWLAQFVQIVVDSSTDSAMVHQQLRAALEATVMDDLATWLTELEPAISAAHNSIGASLSSLENRELSSRTNRELPSIQNREVSDRQRSQPSPYQEVSDRQRSQPSPLSPEEQESGIYVTQAGLVLLHPFLSVYFDAIGLLEGESFRDTTAQQSAIYLLYYLATKQTDAPEYELVLPKLLCGWSLAEPVVRGLELPDPSELSAALREGEHLLQTVIDYWEVLKSTSPDGLREGFLQREGKLTCSDEGNWKLQVEQSAIDILLGRLPWGLSMVKLPWMDDLLIVEWS